LSFVINFRQGKALALLPMKNLEIRYDAKHEKLLFTTLLIAKPVEQ
jgi:hypothetical protein